MPRADAGRQASIARSGIVAGKKAWEAKSGTVAAGYVILRSCLAEARYPSCDPQVYLTRPEDDFIGVRRQQRRVCAAFTNKMQKFR